MSTDDFSAWIGREESRTDRLHISTTAAMAATLDVDSPSAGDPLPPGWQWLFFNPAAPRRELGDDGHPARGGFLPPVPLPRRMWAGSRVRYLADIAIGAEATRRSRILGVEQKVGKRGALCFVTVAHTIYCDGIACIVEEQDIVYRDGGGAASVGPPHADNGTWGRAVHPDEPLLFRYSALTFNGHRIHYDLPYAREVEGYPALVVHGPLTATLLQMFAIENGGGRRLSAFEFRGVAPLFAGRPFRLEARAEGDDRMVAWARGPDGELAMSALATFSPADGHSSAIDRN